MKFRFVVLLLLCLSLLGGCGRRSNASSAAAPDTADPVAVTANAVAPAPAAVDAGLPVPRTPHRLAADLLVAPQPLVANADQTSAMIQSMDRFLASKVPDFAIKDSARPWLDRQYVPAEWKLRETSDGLQADLLLTVLRWDEGREVAPEYLQLVLLWDGTNWTLNQATERFWNDLRDAETTLNLNWAPGERPVPGQPRE